MSEIIATAQDLYGRDRLFRWSLDILVGGAVAAGLMALASALFGDLSGGGQTTVTAPPNTANVVHMPVSAQDIASDNRLKQFQRDAQAIPGSVTEAARCAALIKAAQSVTDYDRERARPVHRTFLAQTADCDQRMKHSDARLAALRTAANAFQAAGEATPETLELVSARANVQAFDEGRPNWGQFAFYAGLADTARVRKDESDQLLQSLQDAYFAFARSPSPDREGAVIEALRAIRPFDRARPEPNTSQLIAKAAAVEAATHERRMLMADFRKILGHLGEGVTAEKLREANKLFERLTEAEAQLLTVEEQAVVTAVRDKTAEAQLRQLDELAIYIDEGASPAVLKAAADQLSLLEDEYAKHLKRGDPASVTKAAAARQQLAASEKRLKVLAQAAATVEAAFTEEAVTELLAAADRLTLLDRQRMTAAQEAAWNLAEQARSGVLESDRRLDAFVTAAADYERAGCSSAIIRDLKSAQVALTDFDLERGEARVDPILARVGMTLSRGYCLDNAIRPVEPLE